MKNISFQATEHGRRAQDIDRPVRNMRYDRRPREQAFDVVPHLRWLGVTLCVVSAAVMLISATLVAFRF